MILPDVNVLVYAYRKDVDDHPRFRDWIHRVVNSGQPYGMSEMVLNSLRYAQDERGNRSGFPKVR